MRTGLKIILTIVAVLIGGMFIALIGEATGRTKGGGPIGLILAFALLAGIRAIWKYNPDKKDIVNNPDNDKHLLDKK